MAFSVSIQYGQILSAARVGPTTLRVTIGIGVGASEMSYYWWATANGVTFAQVNESVASKYLEGAVDLPIGQSGGTVTVQVVAYSQPHEYEPASASVTYYAGYPAQSYTVTFDPGEGTVEEGSRSVAYGSALGTLPTPAPPEGYSFAGWYTAADGGESVTAETICTGAVTYYAHYSPLAILHLATGGAVTTVTDIRVVESGTVMPVLSVWSVTDGTPRQGV